MSFDSDFSHITNASKDEVYVNVQFKRLENSPGFTRLPCKGVQESATTSLLSNKHVIN